MSTTTTLQQDEATPQLTNLRLFQWRSAVVKTSINPGEGLFIFNTTTLNPHQDNPQDNQETTKLATFSFDIIELLSYSQFQAFGYDAVYSFPDRYTELFLRNLGVQVRDLVRSLFDFTNFFKNYSQYSPRLVFVADIRYGYDNLGLEHSLQGVDDHVIPDDNEFGNFTIETMNIPEAISSFLSQNNSQGNETTPTGWDSVSESSYQEMNICPGSSTDSSYHNGYDTEFDLDDDDYDACTDDELGDHTEIDKYLFHLKSWVISQSNKAIRKSVFSVKKSSLVEVKPVVEIVFDEQTGEKQSSYYRYKDNDCTGQNLCSICLDMMWVKEEELVKLRRCNHVFHRRCLSKWLPEKQSCPYCRSSSLVDVCL